MYVLACLGDNEIEVECESSFWGVEEEVGGFAIILSERSGPHVGIANARVSFSDEEWQRLRRIVEGQPITTATPAPTEAERGVR